MTVTRFEPFRLINSLHRDLDRRAERRYGRPRANGAACADWIPAVDIVEEKGRYVLRADLPGVAVDDIDVHMEDGVLTLSGQRQRESVGETGGARRYERSTGKFNRRFLLPDTADAEQITARSNAGILEISIPKLAQAQARRVTVDAA